jgi:hypothetical protein
MRRPSSAIGPASEVVAIFKAICTTPGDTIQQALRPSVFVPKLLTHLASDRKTPPSLAFSLENDAGRSPCLRQSSAVGKAVSCSFTVPIACASMKWLQRIPTRPSSWANSTPDRKSLQAIWSISLLLIEPTNAKYEADTIYKSSLLIIDRC